jgi:hypothetical protein
MSLGVLAQKVTVSRDINIKGNYSYDVLPDIGGNILFFHDKPGEQSFDIFDMNFRYIQNIAPEWGTKQMSPAGIVPMDSTFHFYYTFLQNSQLHYKAIAFDKYATVLDSFTFAVVEKKEYMGRPGFIYSEDKTKVLFFNPGEKGMFVRLVNNLNFETYYEGLLTIPGIQLRNEFRKILLSNEGLVYLITHKESYWDKKENRFFQLVEMKTPKTYSVKRIYPEWDEITQLKCLYDETNKKIGLAGLTSYNDENIITGYLGVSLDFQSLGAENELKVHRFSSQFIADITGRKSGKMKGIPDIKLADMTLRQDGGVILFTETVREYVRRSQIMTPGQFGSFPSRGYMDYYHEDVLVLSTYPNGDEHWKQTLFKKQFSQDDEGAYSSFFLFKTPSRLRMIYNDEISQHNTVSEYVLDPLGNYERKSVLSTEYQNLRLRFTAAFQMGPQTLLVPSEKSSKINLVKIEYP